MAQRRLTRVGRFEIIGLAFSLVAGLIFAAAVARPSGAAESVVVLADFEGGAPATFFTYNGGGAGVGGAQVWFRDTTYNTVTPGSNPTTTALSTDEFVFAWQAYAGIEYTFNDKISLYGDYRHLSLGGIDDDVSDYENTLWTAGVRILFDKEEDR